MRHSVSMWAWTSVPAHHSNPVRTDTQCSQEGRMPDDDDKPNPVLPPVENVRDAEVLLLSVFLHILHHHGLDKTRTMFANYVNEPGTADLDQMSKLRCWNGYWG